MHVERDGPSSTGAAASKCRSRRFATGAYPAFLPVWRLRSATLSGTYSGLVTTDAFSVVCEVEPATRADLMHVRHQIGVMSRIASSFLIPDNHIGRATVSSIAVAHEVALMGGRSIACLNARDRNVLGLPAGPAHRGRLRGR